MTNIEIFWLSPITDCYYMDSFYRRRIKKITKENDYIAAHRIINAVCDHFGVTHEDLIKKSRKPDFVYPRQVCMHLLMKKTNLTLSRIGEMLGGKDHTTVIHSNDKILDLIDVYEDVKRQIKELSLSA